MDSFITKEKMQAYLSRWKIVNTAEREELLNTSMEQKLRQLNSLLSSVKQMGWEDSLAKGEAEVRERWNRLRKAYNA
jgi:hypothetical protein